MRGSCYSNCYGVDADILISELKSWLQPESRRVVVQKVAERVRPVRVDGALLVAAAAKPADASRALERAVAPHHRHTGGSAELHREAARLAKDQPARRQQHVNRSSAQRRSELPRAATVHTRKVHCHEPLSVSRLRRNRLPSVFRESPVALLSRRLKVSPRRLTPPRNSFRTTPDLPATAAIRQSPCFTPRLKCLW